MGIAAIYRQERRALYDLAVALDKNFELLESAIGRSSNCTT
jgi:hypothetical protein